MTPILPREIPAARHQAAATRKASGSRTKLLSTTHPILPDGPLVDRRGRVRVRPAYDTGNPPPALLDGAPGQQWQHLDAADLSSAIADRLASLDLSAAWRKALRSRTRKLINWLAQYEGTTWEERWQATGADAAPRGWVECAFPGITYLQAHAAFIENRRKERPEGEMRAATAEEWNEFDQHFLLRRVALGDWRRPYGTPCVHEHACVRCPFLRVDPAQLGRIEEMTVNAEARLSEAREKTWLGEVAALEESLEHLRRRRAQAQQSDVDLTHQPVSRAR